jgi:hypothetical protein
MNAPNGNVTPSRSFLARHLVTPWDYRHPSVLAGLRLGAGIWMVVLTALLFAIGDWWAAPLLLVAAVLFSATFYVLHVAQQ